jgi:hypothetical protein
MEDEARRVRARHEAGHTGVWLRRFGLGSILRANIIKDGRFGGEVVRNPLTLDRATKPDRLIFDVAGLRCEIFGEFSDADALDHSAHDLAHVYRTQAVDPPLVAVQQWKEAIRVADDAIIEEARFIDIFTSELEARTEIFGPDIDAIWEEHRNRLAIASLGAGEIRAAPFTHEIIRIFDNHSQQIGRVVSLPSGGYKGETPTASTPTMATAAQAARAVQQLAAAETRFRVDAAPPSRAGRRATPDPDHYDAGISWRANSWHC